MKKKDKPEKKSENEAHYAKVALALMQKHGVPPGPENYSVWYKYAVSENKELVREVDNIVNNDMKFTEETSMYLYNKYIIGNREQKAIDESSHNAQKLLMEVLKVIDDLGGETQGYNKTVNNYLENITHDYTDGNIKEMMRKVINATQNLKQSSERMNQKLEASTEEISHLRKNLQQVTAEAQRDFLTGVYNRKTFERLVDEQMVASKENNTGLCLMMIDIDHFKQFNDRFGHLLGDEVLKTVARTLTASLKGRDIVARFGGEEFVVVLPETPIEGAVKVADQIRTALSTKELKRKDTGETFGTITVSMGVSLFRPDSDTLPTMIKRADDALYQSKKTGRNKVTRES